MRIEKKQAAVYFAPTARRRFFKKANAIKAEARAIIRKHFPIEPSHNCDEYCGWCGDPGWSLEIDQPERFDRYMAKLIAALKKVTP